MDDRIQEQSEMNPAEHPFYFKQTLHETSFRMGRAWADLTLETANYILEAVGGDEGLTELAILWTEEYEMGRGSSARKGRDSFFTTKWSAFIAEHVAKRMAE